MKKKIIRVAAAPISLDLLLKGQLNYLNGFFDVLAVASPGEEHERIRRREGVPTVELEIERSISLWKDVKSLWRLFLLFRRERPWGVHSLTPKAGLLSMMAAAFARVPVRVHTFTGLIFPYRRGAFKALLKQMDRLTCLFATHVIPEGEGVRQLLLAEKVTAKPLEILAHGNINGVDTDYFRRSGCREEVRKCLEVPEDAVLFVFVGRITEDKGVRELLAAFSALRAEGKGAPVFLALVGWTEDYAAEELDMPGVFCPGFQEDIRPWLEAADVFVLPSYREGFPNSLLQAGAMELPVIATDVCGCNEIVKDGVNGLLVPARDEEALRGAMVSLRDDPEGRRRMGAEAARQVEGKFSCRIVWDALLNFYGRVSA